MTSGAVRFGRYAYPPNELGYCGPDAHAQLLEQVSARADDADLRRLARGFDGAWPYLELIAAANDVADPLDERVVEAYWVGNGLLERVTPRLLGASLTDRFRNRFGGRAGTSWDRMTQVVPAGAVPHHSFHVLAVYPWLGLLRGGGQGRAAAEPLRVLDRCRVRWGEVLGVDGASAVVRCRPLVWDGRALSLGPEHVESAVVDVAGHGLAGPLRAGDWCSLHWDWVCERLDRRGLAALRAVTLRQLALVNAGAHPAPAQVLA